MFTPSALAELLVESISRNETLLPDQLRLVRYDVGLAESNTFFSPPWRTSITQRVECTRIGSGRDSNRMSANSSPFPSQANVPAPQSAASIIWATGAPSLPV